MLFKPTGIVNSVLNEQFFSFFSSQLIVLRILIVSNVVKLVMEGQINSALRYLSADDSGGVLPLTDDVVRQLREKHPDAQRAKRSKLGSLLFGPVEDIPDSVYQEIKGELVRQAALRTEGSGGPSGVDANGFKRILACKSFKRSSINPVSSCCEHNLHLLSTCWPHITFW